MTKGKRARCSLVSYNQRTPGSTKCKRRRMQNYKRANMPLLFQRWSHFCKLERLIRNDPCRFTHYMAMQHPIVLQQWASAVSQNMLRALHAS